MTNFASYNETYGAIGGVMVLLLWFYVSGIALLIGAELNAEIEHASPYGKDVGEKVPGEKKKIGPAAAARLRRTPREGRDRCAAVSRTTSTATSTGRQPRPEKVRASDLLIGTVALLPAALKIGRAVKKKVEEDPAA